MKKKFKILFFILLISLSTVTIQLTQENNIPEKTVKEMKNAEFFFEKCVSNIKANNIDKAIEFGEKATRLDSSVAKYHFSYGHACGIKARKTASPFTAQKYLKKLFDAWETAIKLDNTNAEYRYYLGDVLYSTPTIVGGSVKKARIQANELLKIKPIYGYLLSARISIKENNYIEAKKNLEKVCELHKKFKKNHPDKKSALSPDELNKFGYELIKAKKIEEAFTILKMNADAFPNHYNVIDSLAYIYSLKGNKELAIKLYEKSLKLNPQKTKLQKKRYKVTVEMRDELKE